MAEAAVQLKLAGQTYRVVTSAAEEELTRLAARVEGVLAEVTPPGRQPSPQSLVLAAVSLAHQLEEEQRRRVELEERYRRVLTGLLGRVDRALGEGTPPAERQRASGELEASAAALVRVPAHGRATREERSDRR
jgi:cell division protein ZapA